MHQSHATMRHRNPLETSDCPEFHHGLVVRALSHCVNAGRQLVAHSSLSAAFVSAFEMPNQDQTRHHSMQLMVRMWLFKKKKKKQKKKKKKKSPACIISLSPFPRMQIKKKKKRCDLSLSLCRSSFLKRLFFFLFLRTLYGRIPRRPTYQHGQDSSARAGSCALYESSSCYSTRWK